MTTLEVPPSYPSDYQVQLMLEDGGNYFSIPTVTDDFYESVIGLYAPTDYDGYIFWHQFISLDGLLTISGEQINIMYQMGDQDSDWQGVYLDSTSGGYTTD